MPLEYTYNPDGSIKSAISVYPDGTPKVISDPTPLPVLGSQPKMSNIPTTFGNILNELIGSGVTTEFDREIFNQVGSDGFVDAMGNDLITGQQGRRNIDDFKKHLKLNKNAFMKNRGLPGEKGSGMQGFNKYLDQLQSGEIGKLTAEEAQFLDDLKNNRINF